MANWDSRYIHDHALRAYWQPTGDWDFRQRVSALLRQQHATWPMLRDAVTGLVAAEYKPLSVKGCTVLTQFNPARIVSTAAKVDAATIKQRACFLCCENLPPEELGVAFNDEFVALCNPFPVLADHLVIAAKEHRPQLIADDFGALLDLTRALGRDWFTLYNGPRCGASAPDHLHFQACARAGVPLFDDFAATLEQSPDTVRLSWQTDYRINVLAASSRKRDELCAWFLRALTELARVTETSEEPLLNLLVTFQHETWTVFLLPRGKHRPACYFAEGDAQLTVSPAAIDLSGVLVVPQPAHFARISATDVAQILAEVTLDDERFKAWLQAIQ